MRVPAVAKIIAKIIQERIKQHLEGLIDREQAGSRFETSCTEHINTLWITLEQWAKFRSSLHLLFIDFEKTFDTVNTQEGHSGESNSYYQSDI